MNERLLDICIKAGINTWPFNEVGFISLDESELVKFAELIVRECCDIVLAPHNETGFTISMDLCKFSTRQAIDRAAQSGGLKVHTQGISKEIKHHFGVEE